jgi:PAS domain S-box-containing protein
MKDAKILADELEAKHIQLELQNEELKRIAQESDELKNRYYELYDFAPVGYVKTDDKGIILEINITGARLLGTERTHILKMPLITFIAVQQRAEFGKFLYQLQVTESRVHSELKLRDRKNDEKYVRLEGSVNKDEHPRSFMIAIIEITERKKAEEKLQNAYREIEQRVEERTAELLEANQSLKNEIEHRKQTENELEKAKDQAELYLDLMGHDISNMHQIILGRLELAEEIIGTEGKLECDDKELIDIAIKNLKRSARLIDNVRQLQKIRWGEYSREPVDLGQMLNDTMASYSSIPDKKVVISYTPARGHVVWVNPLIKEVFDNLLDNAVKHSGDPVQIGIAVDRVDRNGRQYHRVSIEDNGPGIPDKKKDEIFNRLSRGDTKARGTGLGLYIVKTLVESFDGIIEVENRVEGDYTQGSRFLVYLPVVEGDENGK